MTAPIPIFRGQNFEFWKFKLATFLESKGLEVTLQPPRDADKSWRRHDAKARMYILESVDDKHVELIMQETSAKGMVDRLESMYSVSSYSDHTINSKKAVRDDFLALKMADSDDPSHFFREFETQVDMLDDAGDRLTPKEILDCLQMSVSKSYRHLFDEVNPRLDPLEIVELVKKKILAEYAARTNGVKAMNGSKVESPQEKVSSWTNPWNAFKEAFKDEPKECHRCGQSGHFARQCPQPKECYACGQEGHLKFQCAQQQDSCYGCGQPGHRKYECPGRSQPFQRHSPLAVKPMQGAAVHHGSALSKPVNDHRGAESPRNSEGPPLRRQANERMGRESPIRHLEGPPLRRQGNERVGRESPIRSSASPPSHRPVNERKGRESPQHLAPLMATLITPPAATNGEEPIPNADWILDSCATYHTICDEALFSKCIPLLEPINVEVSNGNTLTASKMGEVKACFRVGSHSAVKVLQNVYLIEEFGQNLLSIQKLVQFGGSVILKSTEAELRDASNQTIAFGRKIENLYVIKSYVEKSLTDGFFDAFV